MLFNKTQKKSQKKSNLFIQNVPQVFKVGRVITSGKNVHSQPSVYGLIPTLKKRIVIKYCGKRAT